VTAADDDGVSCADELIEDWVTSGNVTKSSLDELRGFRVLFDKAALRQSALQTIESSAKKVGVGRLLRDHQLLLEKSSTVSVARYGEMSP
jgi:hypothetical protein